MRMIIIAGMPGAGKEEFLNTGRDAGIPFVRMGDLVREYYSGRSEGDRALPIGEFAGIERERHGKDVWAKRAVERMDGDLFLVDGCRSLDEIRSFRKLGNPIVVAIHASPEARYERLVNRAREDAPANADEFEGRDSRELSWGVGDVMALSDYMLDNSGSLEDFHRRSSELMESLR